jgi:polynucleotide 5'-kinase involved in rRNA processing
VDEIDRVIRAALPAGPTSATVIDDTDNPSALIRALRRGKDLTHKIFLLVGSVGSGKSTFVDYFREVKLSWFSVKWKRRLAC